MWVEKLLHEEFRMLKHLKILTLPLMYRHKTYVIFILKLFNATDIQTSLIYTPKKHHQYSTQCPQTFTRGFYAVNHTGVLWIRCIMCVMILRVDQVDFSLKSFSSSVEGAASWWQFTLQDGEPETNIHSKTCCVVISILVSQILHPRPLCMHLWDPQYQYHTSSRPSKCTDHLSRHCTQDLVPTCRLISVQGRLLQSWSLLRPEPAGLCWIRTSRWAFRACFNLDTSSGLQEPRPLAAQTQTDPLGWKTGHTHIDCSCACWSELSDDWSISSGSDSCSNLITVSVSEVFSCFNAQVMSSNRTWENLSFYRCWRSASVKHRHCGPSSLRSFSSRYHGHSVTSPEKAFPPRRTWQRTSTGRT